MSKNIPTGKELGGGQSWLSPKGWGSGKYQDSLTGDRTTDMRQNLAKYGLHAAAWAPALLNESGKKGSEMRQQANTDAIAAQQQSEFDAIQPNQNNVPFQGNNQFTKGPYNDIASGLASGPGGQNQMSGLLSGGQGILPGEMTPRPLPGQEQPQSPMDGRFAPPTELPPAMPEPPPNRFGSFAPQGMEAPQQMPQPMPPSNGLFAPQMQQPANISTQYGPSTGFNPNVQSMGTQYGQNTGINPNTQRMLEELLRGQKGQQMGGLL